MRIVQTHPEERGQIYIPLVNWLLDDRDHRPGPGLPLVGQPRLGLRRRGLDRHGDHHRAGLLRRHALGLERGRPRRCWRLAFLVVDLAFFGANLFKIADGGWYPLRSGALVFTLMATWRRGRQVLAEQLRTEQQSLEDFLARA